MSTRPLYVGPFLHLRTLPPFAGLSPAQLRELAYEAQEVMLPRGTALVEQGEPCGAMYLIVDGFVDVEQDEPVGPGGVVGFLDVLTSDPGLAGAVASTDVVALRVESDALRDVCEQSFAVLGAILMHVADLVADDREAQLRSIAGRGAAELPAGTPLDRVGRITAFHRAPAFPTRHMDALAELAGHVVERHLAPGESLWEVGEEALAFYLITSGAVDLTDPRTGATVQFGAGAAPGLVETLAGRQRSYLAVGARPVVMLRVDVEPFMDVIEDHFEMAFGLLGWLARNLIESRLGRAQGGRR
ncbi:MAG: cyclic nucleotide-binding domain-containing protein [Acidobacteriota bacterium]|nr:cyclic nucleotide-binding domain-containing protein [Acidobacteriota bacterium]